ncbi:hypothetical protein [uncultured Shewanella sp.]|uniref:hypothetical protein n=1 Tax=uncultured Shewanella sp. TaxID=173975 RepID=UPI002615EEC1|nr:hypothetical protein [uncultured Shewanella sp.]
MIDELKQLKKNIEQSIIEERNHIIKYMSALIYPQSNHSKVVNLEYNRFTRDDRYHNYNIGSCDGSYDVKEIKILSFYEFLAHKLTRHVYQDRQSYTKNNLIDSITIYNDDGEVDGRKVEDYEFSGETEHEIFETWLLFDLIFEVGAKVAKEIQTKNFIAIPHYLDLIDKNFNLFSNVKNSDFQLKMNQDELYSWLELEINQFKHRVEEQGLWKSLKKEPEKHFQHIFSAALYRVCEIYNVDLSAEPDVGSGKVDFKFSQGHKSKVCVELKLSTSEKALTGYTHQLQQYLISEKTDKGIYVIINNGNVTNSYNELLTLKEKAKKEGNNHPEIILIDARQKISASKQ